MNYNDKNKFYIIDCPSKKFKDITNMEEFYNVVGIIGLKPNDDTCTIDVTSIWVNTQMNKEIEETIRKNARKSKKYKDLTDRGLNEAIGWEMLMYSPAFDDSVPMGKIYIDKEHFLYKNKEVLY